DQKPNHEAYRKCRDDGLHGLLTDELLAVVPERARTGSCVFPGLFGLVPEFFRVMRRGTAKLLGFGGCRLTEFLSFRLSGGLQVLRCAPDMFLSCVQFALSAICRCARIL